MKAHRPAAIVLLGDVQATRPLHDELADILALTQVAWIPGNHDADSPSDFDHLFNSALAGRNLHGRVITVAGTRIAGLGGVFREKVWMPPAEPIYGSAAELLRDTKRTVRGRGGLPLKHRSAIFHKDYLHLARLQADMR